MLLPLLIAATTSLPADTLLVPGVVLLGEPIDVPTYVREDVRGVRPSVTGGSYASMPLPSRESPGLPIHFVEAPNNLGFSRSELDRALSTIEEEVYRGGFPGAAVAIGRWDRTAVERGIGTLDRGLGSPAVDPDHTIYDLASLTKVVATTTAVMLLIEDGKMHLDDPVARFLPEFTGGYKDRVTIRHLLTHSSGLPAGGSASGPTPDRALGRALTIPLKTRPGQTVEYSDIGFIVLWAAAERAHGAPLEGMLARRVFEPLGMDQTGFRPGENCVRCAPTEDRPGYRGLVHDPLARNLGGVAGHAGLFSTVHDLARFASMMANGGELDGVRILRRATIDGFTARQPGAGTRALGWDTPDQRGTGAGGVRISSSSYGHTGFTGTSMWIDPARGTWVILLSNRTFKPAGPNRMQAIRRELNDRVATSVDLSVDR
jgi:CubicO group peptidase (beta-lactamase class C family)